MADSKRSTDDAARSEKPLFQGQEEQERIYSPQQVPGSNVPPVERDNDDTSAQGTAVATDDNPDDNA